MVDMADEKAIIVRSPAALARRPSRALMLRPAQAVIPAAGVALALAWGAGKLIGRLLAQRRAPVRVSLTMPRPESPARIHIYRASWSITVVARRGDE
jgi:hypothetical protein